MIACPGIVSGYTMTRAIAVAFLALLAAAAGVSTSQPAVAQSTAVPLVEPATLHGLMAAGVHLNIVDVRQPEEFNQGHIQGAVLMPLGNLSATYSTLPKTGKLVVYCRSGHRSAQAAQFLMQNGYKNVVSLHGGYMAWTAAGYH